MCELELFIMVIGAIAAFILGYVTKDILCWKNKEWC